MNCKLNKIFTKSCAAILAVSNIFSGVGAAKNENPGKASDNHNQLSVSKEEFFGSILGASGFATLATLFLSKMIFSAKSTLFCINTEDDFYEMLKSMALALKYTVSDEVSGDGYSGCEFVTSSCLEEVPNQQGNTCIDEKFLINEWGLCSYSDLLKKGDDISVTVDGVRYKYVMSNIENPSGIVTKEGNLSRKLVNCVNSIERRVSAVDAGFTSQINKRPFVIHLTAVGSNKTAICRKHTVFKFENFGNSNIIKCLSPSSQNTTNIDTTNASNKSELYPGDKSSDKALIVVGCWQKQN